MEAPKDKAALLEAMNAGRQEWEAVLSQVTDAQLKMPNVDGVWSIQDILAHITGYEQYAWAMLSDSKKDETRQTAMFDAYYQTHLTLFRASHPEYPEQIQKVRAEQINELFAAAYRYKLPREVRAMEKEAYLNLLQWVQMLTEAELAKPFTPDGKNFLQILPNQCYVHYRLHIPPIKAWLEKQV